MFIATTSRGSNPKAEGRRPKEGRNPKAETRIALGLGFRYSDFKAARLATNMPPLRGLLDLAARLAINMSPLRGWSDRAVRLAISFSLSPSEGERVGVRGWLAGQTRRPKPEPRSASGFGLRISTSLPEQVCQRSL